MSSRNIHPVPGKLPNGAEGAPAAEPEDVVLFRGQGSRKRAEAAPDFNPLMERAIRAQQLAEGRRSGAPSLDLLPQ